MRHIFAIANNTFRETIRDRILYVIMVFSLLFLASTVVLGSISLGEDLKVIRDFGMAGIYLFGFVITVFLGASLMYKEIKERTIYLLLTKPVTEIEIVVGKFLGLLASVTMATVLMTLVYLLVVLSKGGGFDWRALSAISLQIGELSIFIGVAILFSLLSTPMASVLYSICILYIGHTLPLLLEFGKTSGGIIFGFTAGLYYILPNLEKFNVRDLVIYQENIPVEFFIYAIVYSCMYTMALLLISATILRHKEL